MLKPILGICTILLLNSVAAIGSEFDMKDSRWIHLLQGKNSGKLKNKFLERLPSEILTNSLKELTEVHLKSYQEDPNYACRFPAQYSYLKTFFSDPFPFHDCQINTLVRLSGPEPYLYDVDLNPDRIYEARFMIASKSKELVSRFGHAMIHLVRCAPERPLGEDCRKDIEHHVVVSYRGQVDSLKMSSLKGITGKYRVQPFFFLLPKSIDEYTGEQSRSLTSYAFNFNRQELSNFVYRLIEDFWVYRSGYNFINRNCATEVRDVVKSIKGDRSFMKSKSKMPYEVLEDLGEAGLIEVQKGKEIIFDSMEKADIRAQSLRIDSELMKIRTKIAIELKKKDPSRAKLYEELYEQIQQQFIHSRDALGYGIPLKEEMLKDSKDILDQRKRQKALLEEIDQDPRVQTLLEQKTKLL